jgi:preprotein translocase subunit SecE
MARDRQRAKQRQAERRARRLAQRGAGRQARPVEPTVEDPTVVEPSPAVDPNLAVGAPPQEEGRSDMTVEADEELLEEELLEEDEELEEEALQQEAIGEIEDEELGRDGQAATDAYAPRGRRGAERAAAKERPRLVQFLIASWAELQRVQWPDRQTLTTLTGVTLGFVLVVGGYLGLLDAIFSKLIQAIL